LDACLVVKDSAAAAKLRTRDEARRIRNEPDLWRKAN
jgi:hypothetical protein